jgi:hypothetical protein
MTFPPPPQGSKIRLETERGHDKIIAPHPSGGFLRFVVVGFLAFWLCGWCVGFVAVGSTLFLGLHKQPTAQETTTSPPDTTTPVEPEEMEKGPGVDLFLIVWLTFWTIGGGTAAWSAYRLIRPSVPETFLLNSPMLLHDPGIAPVRLSFDYRAQMQQWKDLYKRRKKREFTPEQVGTLRLRETESSNRLTIDVGHERLDLASTLTEVEREWLFAALASRYQLAALPPPSRP